ncbi:TPA: transcriptional regulator [Candidatus Gastranaerophilales bacterium HUM_9]|nr:MAG TPA: transcriptional regulator [Candidatus Gastranaerophilales bacterium HUM_9]HBX34595.1 transcriptional regulator [Cyanobacteria bacterium UBA11440]
MIPIFDSKRQYAQIGADIEKNVCEVLRSGSYILGQNTKALEQELADYIGVKYTVGLNSGTDALHIALRALDIGHGDEVITTAFTFVATAEAIGIVGAKPVFVDIDADTFNIDPAKIEAAITPKTKAIIPVHLYGQPCDMDRIMDIAKRHNLHVIEDCCQAIGSTYKGQKVGTFGDFGCYSFYPTKNLGTMGDGGLLTTNSESLKNRAIALRNHGGAVRYHHDEIGVNSRLDEIQAAILRTKLPYIDEWNSKRREIASYYNELFANCEDIVTPKELDNTYCVYHQYTVKVPNRDEIFEKMHDAGIGAMLYYPIPLHLQKVHNYLGMGKGSLPITERNTEIVMSLPMFPELTREEQQTVANTLIKLVEDSKVLA